MSCLSGRKILITSGPTRAPLDAVRYLTNKSSGRLGSIIALQALRHGAQVTFVYGKDSAKPAACGVDYGATERFRLIEVETVQDVVDCMKRELATGYDVLIHAMAVLDFAPVNTIPEKTSSDQAEWVVHLVPTPKVIKVMRELAPRALLVGFKLEYGRSSEEGVAMAYQWLRRSGADFVLANDLAEIEQGHHIGRLVNRSGEVLWVEEGKQEIARHIIETVADQLQERLVNE